jgi:hypothetical protein
MPKGRNAKGKECQREDIYRRYRKSWRCWISAAPSSDRRASIESSIVSGCSFSSSRFSRACSISECMRSSLCFPLGEMSRSVGAPELTQLTSFRELPIATKPAKRQQPATKARHGAHEYACET